MRDTRLICSVLLCILIHTSGYGQWRKPLLYHLGPEQGLTSWIFDITQDSTGYMYFGTVEGLVRYDGSTFQLFAHDPYDSTSIGPGDVWTVLATSDGMIWAGTRLSGLNRFDPKTKTFKHYSTPQRDSTDYDSVHALYEDEDHKIWVGGYHYVLSRFDPEKGTFETYTPSWLNESYSAMTGAIIAIFQDEQDKNILWLSVTEHAHPYRSDDARGLVSFHKKTKVFEAFNCWGLPKYQRADHQLILAGYGINQFDPMTGSCLTFPIEINGTPLSPRIIARDLVSFDHKFLLCGSNSIYAFTPGKGYETIMQDQSKGIVEDIYIDHENHLWFGRTQGASFWNGADDAISYYSLSGFGTDGRIYPGKLAYDPGKETVYIREQPANEIPRRILAIPLNGDGAYVAYESHTAINGMAVDRNRHLWIASSEGLVVWDIDQHKQLKQYPTSVLPETFPRVWNLTAHKPNWIAGVSSDAVIWFNTDGPTFTVLHMSDFPKTPGRSSSAGFQGLAFTERETMYVFSNEIYEIDLHSGHVTRLSFQRGVNPFPLTEINSVLEDNEGHVWVSTLAMTASFVRKSDSLILIKKYTPADGLNFAWAHELYADRAGRIWAFTSNGITAIDPVSGQIRYVGHREGLEDPYIDPRQILTLRDESLVTVNANGIIHFHPDSLWEAHSLRDVPIVIRDVRIEGKSLQLGYDVNFLTQIDLRPGQSYLDVRFQALAYPTDQNIRYSYKVDGLRDEWISIGDNKLITLASLHPGDYVLHIKTGNPGDHSPEKELHIHVLTPWYQHAWFQILGAVLILSLLLFGLRHRIRSVRKQEAAKASITKQMAELELKALRAQMNPHFMFNSLNSIKNYILQAEPKKAAEYLSNFSHLIRMILQHSSEKVISLKDELEILTLYIELEDIRFDGKFDFTLDVEDTLETESILIPPMLLQPYVENAIWHGLLHKPNRGHLTLQFRAVDQQVECIIEDDGIGRQEAARLKSLSARKYKSMGMGITRERIEILNNMQALGISADIIDRFDAEGKPAGTRVIVRIPYTYSEVS